MGAAGPQRCNPDLVPHRAHRCWCFRNRASASESNTTLPRTCPSSYGMIQTARTTAASDRLVDSAFMRQGSTLCSPEALEAGLAVARKASAESLRASAAKREETGRAAVMEGHILKKRRGRRGYEWRFLILRANGQLLWWESAKAVGSSEPEGWLRVGLCALEPDVENRHIFVIKPAQEAWICRPEGCEELIFNASRSEVPAQHWCFAIRTAATPAPEPLLR